MAQGESIVDGSLDFSGGVDSVKVTTIQSAQNPNGLQRNELAWLDNATVRDGGISPRNGMVPIIGIWGSTGLFQGQFLYEPDNADPYFIVCISGNVLKVDPSVGSVQNLSAAFSLSMPTTEPYFYFVQAEQFLVIQAGDYVTLPLFWDGATLRRSIGITNTAVMPGTPGVNEIPAAGPMDYYMGRLWYAQFRNYSAGDIVGGASGTLAYNFRDAVLNVTENPLVVGGDGFTVPDNAGNIRALRHSANLNTALGQGQLFIFTRKAVYSLSVPVTRADWIAATNANQPLQTVVQLVNGSVNDRSVVEVNGDLYYQTLEPGIRSLISAVRYFQQPGNIQISNNEQRILEFNDRALLHNSTGTYFNNRLLESALPIQKPQGVVHQALIPLDFIPMSSFNTGLVPCWEGMYEGLDFLQLAHGDFGGRDRCFATIVSRADQTIQLWELTDFDTTDGSDLRISWYLETPAYTWGREFKMKKLEGAEIWVDRVRGNVDLEFYYRPDADPCWILWDKQSLCAARTCAEDVHTPACYPILEECPGYKFPITLPAPPEVCDSMNVRPANQAYQFQMKIVVHGWMRIRGILMHARPLDRAPYEGLDQ